MFTQLVGPSGAQLIPLAINSQGDVTGFYLSTTRTDIGFLYDSKGLFTQFIAPSGGSVIPESITDAGQILGTYFPLVATTDTAFIFSSGNLSFFGLPGAGSGNVLSHNLSLFSDLTPRSVIPGGGSGVVLFDPISGVITSIIPPPGATNSNSRPFASNSSGQVLVIVDKVVNVTPLETISLPYLYTAGEYTLIAVPNATSGNPLIVPTGVRVINDAGVVGGIYITLNDNDSGMFFYKSGTYTTISNTTARFADTISKPPGFQILDVTGINSSGEAVGEYEDNNGLHGFLYSGGTFTTVDLVEGSPSTVLTGINSRGQIIGHDLKSGIGFVTDPETPEAFWSEQPGAAGSWVKSTPFQHNVFQPGINDVGIVGDPLFAQSGIIPVDGTIGTLRFQRSSAPGTNWSLTGTVNITTLTEDTSAINISALTATVSTLNITDGSTVEVKTANKVNFGAGTNETLILSDTINDITSTITGFQSGDAIDFIGRPDLTLSAEFGADDEVALWAGTSINSRQVATLHMNGMTQADQSKLEVLDDGLGGTKVVFDTTDFKFVNPPGIDDKNWTFIRLQEGFELAPYIPPNSAASGVTVGSGVDLGGGLITDAVLTEFFPDWQHNNNLGFIENAFNDNGTTAPTAISDLKTRQFTAPVGDNIRSLAVSITTSQANKLSSLAEQKIYDELVAAYDNAAGAGTWATLEEGAKTAIADVAYNFGVTGMIKKAPIFWNDVIHQDWAAADRTLFHFGSHTQAATDRREADGRELEKITALANTPPQIRPVPANVAPSPTGVLPPGASTSPLNIIDPTTTTYVATIADISTILSIDPAGSEFTLLEDVGSPHIRSLVLPAADAPEYLVSYLKGDRWSDLKLALPGDTLTFDGDGASALQVVLLDENGVPLAGSPDFTFYTTFVTTGDFSATVLSSVAGSLPPPEEPIPPPDDQPDDNQGHDHHEPDDNQGHDHHHHPFPPPPMTPPSDDHGHDDHPGPTTDQPHPPVTPPVSDKGDDHHPQPGGDDHKPTTPPETPSTGKDDHRVDLCDQTTQQTTTVSMTPYSGPVAGLTDEYIYAGSHNMVMSTSRTNVFLHSGSGDDALQVFSGSNVLDGSTGSNYLVGGAGNDTFYVDDRGPSSDIWSTIVGFHSGDNATIWGVTADSFANLLDDQGAEGARGMTNGFVTDGHTVNVTFADYSKADMGDRLTVSFGVTPDMVGLAGSTYMNIHGN